MKNILELVEAAARRTPDKIAFADEHVSITYKALCHRAKCIGSYLSRLKSKGAPIAVYMGRNVDAIAAFLGVVYSGNFYVVLDDKSPPQRINAILETLQPVAFLTDNAHRDHVACIRGCGQVLYVEDGEKQDVNEEKLRSIRRAMVETDPLYALFTSGSTGVPKGVVIHHRNVLAYAAWVTEAFSMGEGTVFGNQTPFYFSMSVLDIFTTLYNGATMHVIPKSYFAFPVQLVNYLNQRGVNTLYWVPSAYGLVMKSKILDYIAVPTVHTILFAGEVMPARYLNYLKKYFPEALYANLYGPTEVTDICAYYIVDRAFRDDEAIPMGAPCDNCGLLILREDGSAALPGEEGELCVRGPFVGMGYYNNPEKTAEVFVQNPLNSQYPEVIYRTGDLVRTNHLGQLMYLTRKDFQIKHNGYRIEPGEVETAAGALENITACACLFDSEENKLLLVYEGEEGDEKAMKRILANRLPPYMMPENLYYMASLPRNANGKMDRVRLREQYCGAKQREEK